MKKIFSILSLLVFTGLFAQSLPIYQVNNLKITAPVKGTAHDSVLVWRGNGDKVARWIPVSELVSSASGNFVKLDPSPATSQTILETIAIKKAGGIGPQKAFQIIEANTNTERAYIDADGDIYSAGEINCTGIGTTTINITTPNSDSDGGSIGVRKDYMLSKLALKANDDDVIHKTGDEVKTGNLQLQKTTGTGRMWVQADAGIASLRLQNGTDSTKAAAVYQDATGNMVVQNARPGAYLDLTVTEPGGITSSAIKATPISQDLSEIDLSGNVNISNTVHADGRINSKVGFSTSVDQSAVIPTQFVFTSPSNPNLGGYLGLHTSGKRMQIQGYEDTVGAVPVSLQELGGTTFVGDKMIIGATIDDGNLLQVNGTISASSDIEVKDNTRGLILKDSVTGVRYRLQVTSGVLAITALP